MSSTDQWRPTGQQWTIRHGDQQAVVTEVGATLRSYEVAGRAIIDGFGIDEWAQDGRGQVLAPWPNRLGDGRYAFSAIQAQAALDEPERGNAIHGLVRWIAWRLVAHAQNSVTLGCTLHPTPGYPFALALRVQYRLGREGLVVTAIARNPGVQDAPFGIGFHPYLRVRSDRIDSAILRLPAHERLVLDARGLPTSEVVSVRGTEFDFTCGRVIGSTRLDAAYTGLHRDANGLAWASLADPESTQQLCLWVDAQFDYLMCYTGDGVTDAERRRRAIAIEPMTCPPDAFRSGIDVVTLPPGGHWEGEWGLQVR